MSFWIVLLVALFLVGSIAMVRPSARDRRVSQLRQQAALAGLRIKMADTLNLPFELPHAGLACYALPRKEEDVGPFPRGRLQFRDGTDRFRVMGDLHRFESELDELITRLPAGCEVLFSDARQVAILWDEQSQDGAIEKLQDCLGEMYKWRLPERDAT